MVSKYTRYTRNIHVLVYVLSIYKSLFEEKQSEANKNCFNVFLLLEIQNELEINKELLLKNINTNCPKRGDIKQVSEDLIKKIF